MSSLDVAQAKRNFDRLLARASKGEEIVIAKEGRPLARLTAPHSSPERKERQFGRIEREIWMSDDFEDPLDDFEASRRQ